ncbi:MAG: nucleotidyltransferase domain-containing protein [Candidatus Magasanikbacteria bacterium]|nr:nucleotidyltransferase domain-containing protein [Candidatus Magasanikbacteria bacterium]
MAIAIPQKIQQELVDLGVVALYLFGSRAQGVAGPLADYDFGVLLDDPLRVQRSSFELYGKLYEILSKVTHPETLEADVIDIVFLDSPRVSLELKFNIIRHGRVLFDSNPRRRVDAEERIMEAYCDFRPLLKMFDQAVLARL